MKFLTSARRRQAPALTMLWCSLWYQTLLLTLLVVENAFSGVFNSSESDAFSEYGQFQLVDPPPDLHPTLFFNQDDIPLLRKKSSTTHSHIFRIIRSAVMTMLSTAQLYMPPSNYEEFSSKWNEIYGNNLPPLALYCSLYPEDQAAVHFLTKFMDRMAKYPNWKVASRPNDDVPVAHSLTGFATAFDFIYPLLDPQRRDLYLNKIHTETKSLYEASKYRGWGKQFLQNHQTTNFLAILTGAIVVGAHDNVESTVWKQVSLNCMEKTMFLLNHVVDGSLGEGVAYGSYAAKSITQYVFLAQRHFSINNTQNNWLRTHFWFYYATLLPGFQRTVGIGDSNYNWFYGPESQLVFLDTFVLGNGSGNWLAQQIRKHRPKDGPMGQSFAQHWATLHTEFLWYNANLAMQPPFGYNTSRMHIFSNWGVVTYGAGVSLAQGNTFVSFKSGKLGGRAVFDIVHTKLYPWVDGWNSFNPGHEHPDQNSFTFAPNGQVFVSEALYGPKYSYLNNVLVFSPSPTSQCNVPWEGQLGECGKWLRWTDRGVGDSAGELVAASSHLGTMFVSGEAVGAYSPAMKLKSVFRALVLLNSQTLLVVDHVEKRPDSLVNTVSAFFHNLDIDFKYVPFRFLHRYNGALMDIWDAHYKMFWFDSEGYSPGTQIQEAEQAAEFKKRWTQFINVTFPFKDPVARMAYVLHGPYVKISNCRFLESSANGVRLSLVINGTEKIVSIATNHKDIGARYRFLGFGGHAKIKDRHQIVQFGLETQHVLKRTTAHNHLYDFGLTVNIVAGITLCLTIVFLTVQRKLYICFSGLMRFALVAVLILWITEILFVPNDCDQRVCSVNWQEDPTSPESSKGPKLTNLPLPTVVITALPGSGSDILKQLFYNNTDFVYLQVPSEHFKVPEEDYEFDSFLDACEWTRIDAQYGRLKATQAWLSSLVHDTHAFLRNLTSYESTVSKNALRTSLPRERRKRRRSRGSVGEMTGGSRLGSDKHVDCTQDLSSHTTDHPNACVVLNLWSGGWGLKLTFLQEVIGPSLRVIYVVRDPRAWIYLMTHNQHSLLGSPKSIPQHLALILGEKRASDKCPASLSMEFKALYQLIARSENNSILLLAHLWRAHTTSVLRVASALSEESFLQVKFEDVINHPLETARTIHSFLRLPVSPSALNQLLFSTSTSLYSLMYERNISPDKVNDWMQNMSKRDIGLIENTCGSLMSRLGYSSPFRD